MNNEHSIIAHSAAGIWGKFGGCTAYPIMVKQYPETEKSEDALKGDAAHELGEKMLYAGAHANMNMPVKHETINTKASNGILIDDLIFEAAELYAQDVITIMHQTRVYGGDKLGIEEKVEAKKIHDLSFGTLDARIFDPANNSLYMWDFKSGYGVVEVFECWQLINNCAGLLEKLQINGLYDQKLKIHFRIVQPNAYHRLGPIREWIVTASDLRAYFNQLNHAAHEALSEKRMFQTGNHCKYCCARYACNAALNTGMSLYETVSKPVPMDLTPQQIGLQYSIVQRAREQLEFLESSYEEQIKRLQKSGIVVPGVTYELTYGRKKWNKPVKEILALGELMGVNLKKPDDVITPNQASKLSIDSAIIDAYSIRDRSGTKLVLDSETRVRSIFGELKNGN